LGLALARGFTLLEVLIVLALVGMLAAVSLPQFSVIQDRLAFTLSRDTFENELNGLGYSAFKQGRPMILAGRYPRRPGDAPVLPGEDDSVFKEILFLQPGQLKTLLPLDAVEAKFDLPENWQLSVVEPIVYQASGYCAGGKIEVNVGGARYAYDLKAPACAVELAE
jgi:prepilin-type N-terminal cleavage/methylation domain-containing protein